MRGMKLHLYMEAHRLTPREVGERVGVTTEAVRRWLRGETPSSTQLRKIYEVTDGIVAPNDFFLERTD